MTTLEELRARKLAELQRQQQSQLGSEMQEELAMRQQIQQLEDLMKQHLTKEALVRYGNVKTAYPDMALQLSAVIAQLVRAGRVKTVDDNLLKELLKELTPKKRDINIKVARK